MVKLNPTSSISVSSLDENSRLSHKDAMFEILVLEGECTIANVSLKKHCWLRALPGFVEGGNLTTSEQGCTLYVKLGHLRPS